jgi:NAD(P)-dependent dehydrogenase (short-subunit alcohol dehydrogenase family)
VAHFARQGTRVAFFDIQDESAQKLIDSLKEEVDS